MNHSSFFLLSMGILTVVFCLFAAFPVIADTDGVWHEAEDVRPGTFGDDEQQAGNSYTFINPVFFNENLRLPNIAFCNGKLYTNNQGTIRCGVDRVVDQDANATNELQDLESVVDRGNHAGNQRIEGVRDPVNAQDAATKSYVDSNTLKVYDSGWFEVRSIHAGGSSLYYKQVDLTQFSSDYPLDYTVYFRSLDRPDRMIKVSGNDESPVYSHSNDGTTNYGGFTIYEKQSDTTGRFIVRTEYTSISPLYSGSFLGDSALDSRGYGYMRGYYKVVAFFR